jgi:hypothetical protein
MMTTPFNMGFTIFILDSRSLADLCPSLDEMFGGHFIENEELKAAGRPQYDNYVFGLGITVSFEETWTTGNVYRLAAGNHPGYRHRTPDEAGEVDMAFHVLHLLRNIGSQQMMTMDEFRESSRQNRTPKKD